jgi:O-antigen/teichoic acid export membrane protein
MAATAPALVSVIYGRQWVPMTTILELLCIAAIPQTIITGMGGPLRALGRTGLLFRISLVAASTTIVAVLIGLPFGITGVATATLVNSWLLLPICMTPLARAFDVRWSKLFWAIFLEWKVAFGVGLGEVAVRIILPARTTRPLELFLQLAVGAFVYFMMLARSSSEVAVWIRARLARLPRWSR